MSDGVTDPFAPLTPKEQRARRVQTERPTDRFEPLLPAPCPLPSNLKHYRLGTASRVWLWQDKAERLLFATCRFDKKTFDANGKREKEVLPFTFGTLSGRAAWYWRAPNPPRPLYRLPQIAAAADAPLLVVEGEKTTDEATELFPELIATTSQGGARAARQADWSPLHGRDVAIWPDNDAPGRGYAADVAELARAAGARSVRTIAVPESWPDGWDLADPLPEGVDFTTLRSMLEADGGNEGELEPAPMPPGFTQTTAGIFLKSDDPEKPDTHVCGPLHVVASTHDGSGDDWGALLRWHDDDGRLHEWAMPRAMLAGDATVVRERLLRGGLFVGTSRKAREALATYLMLTRPASRVRSVPRLGWHETVAGSVFVLPRETIAARGAERVRMQTERPELLPSFASNGSLLEWQEPVAALAVGNSRLALAISMAFAAPLLGLLVAEGGGVHFRGPSSIGKSATAIAAGSVWGGGGLHGWLQRWRATDNGLEWLAAGHCDLLLTLDEIAEIEPRALALAAYRLANGGGKNRAEKYGGGRRPPSGACCSFPAER